MQRWEAWGGPGGCDARGRVGRGLAAFDEAYAKVREPKGEEEGVVGKWWEGVGGI